MVGQDAPVPPRYIKALLYIFKDFECQPDCRPTSKIFKGTHIYLIPPMSQKWLTGARRVYMYPVGYIIYYTHEFEICQEICLTKL